MRFPPPIRITAPLLALVFGLVATWFGYRLNLDLDLARHLEEVRLLADSNGRRLARLSEQLVAADQREVLRLEVQATVDLPLVELAVVVDQNQQVLADSTEEDDISRKRRFVVMDLINPAGGAVVQQVADGNYVASAHPFRVGDKGTGWVLMLFDRGQAIAAARTDAWLQLRWMALAMGFLSFALWAVLHFGFAARLARLAGSVKAFGEGKGEPVSDGGRDEVGVLSGAFAMMAANLRTRETEQLRLEREVLEISEGERRRIGHDLHDGLGQRLTAASMTANALVASLQTDASPLAARGEEIGRQLREAIAEARALSHGLAPVALVDDGLANALATLAEDTSRGGSVRCVLECPKPVRVPDAEMAGHLYRIAQEAVNNALKHAGASEIRIGLEHRNGEVVLEIDDDGEGFPETAPAKPGIGLRVMRYRARLIGGVLEIGSPPAGGARIACHVKLPV